MDASPIKSQASNSRSPGREVKTYCIGDLHGNYRGLIQAIERSPFDRDKDKLITLGDYIDGGVHIECQPIFHYLLSLPNWIGILGNHDQWMIEAFEAKKVMSADFLPLDNLWYMQGGKWTISEISGARVEACGVNGHILKGDIPEIYTKFMNQLKLFHVENDICYCHAGWKLASTKIDQSISYITDKKEIYWTRGFWQMAEWQIEPPYEKVFIGHTQKVGPPERRKNIWNLDTGAGGHGYVTIMDVDTEQFWQSDATPDLYENYGFR